MKHTFFILFSMITQMAIGQKIEKIYLNENDSTTNCYLTVSPQEIPCKGYLFLIPSFYESPEHVMEQTDLPILAAQKGILTIIPTFKTGLASFGIDSLTQLSLKEIIEDAHIRYNLKNLKFYIGGFSIGGSCVVKFAEDAVKDNYQHQPNGIFVVDPPLDFIRFYNSYKRTLRIAPNSGLRKEAIYMTERIEKEMGGTPSTNLQNYIDKSPYCFTDTNQTAIKQITNIPIRYYTEPELNWKMKKYGSSDFSDINGLDGSCMINELVLLGNTNAQLILTKNKGYRKPNHRKQPHSWSIIDDEELIQWLQSLQ
ncbi:alpha/beta hydrolase [Aureispira anguillae]|uniref:Alpha/beta hydrolase n=1 Tax=Aureispira anguillae TaxID=2864201 RepID=A0A915YEA4_9BACT|nr:alpha/beta hydrolase [Aureispira anguillae]BDS11519.1 alpha/beta hydrolase [Aureispira anguillae]